jgi:metallophosphoesterase superfamily enzyme
MVVVHDWLLTPQRVAIHLPTCTAVAADLHLGYAEARRRSGEAVPEVALEGELADLDRCCRLHKVRRLLIAGDLLEDCRIAEMLERFSAWLGGMGIESAGLIPGNHDRLPRAFEARALQVFTEPVVVGGWHVIHGHEQFPSGRVIQGHEHPSLGWGKGQRAPCYLVAEHHMILPAYSRDAAGVNVLRVRRWSTYRCCAVANDTLFDLGPLLGVRRRLRSLVGW